MNGCLSHRDGTKPLVIDVDSESGTGQSRSPPPPLESQVLASESFSHEVLVVRPFDVTDIFDVAGEGSAGGGENAGLAYLAAELVAEIGSMGQ
jgi:hypothetical protein